jgi:hypothetical protein
MKYVKLFENFHDNLDDIKWALISSFDTDDFNIITDPLLKDEFIVVNLPKFTFYTTDQGYSKSASCFREFRSFLTGIDENYKMISEIGKIDKKLTLVIIKSSLSDVLQNHFGFRDEASYKKYLENRINKIAGKWVNIQDILNHTGSYDFNLKMDLIGNIISVEIEEGSELISFDDKVHDLKKIFSNGPSKDVDWEIKMEVEDLIIDYIKNTQDLPYNNAIKFISKYAHFVNDIAWEGRSFLKLVSSHLMNFGMNPDWDFKIEFK